MLPNSLTQGQKEIVYLQRMNVKIILKRLFHTTMRSNLRVGVDILPSKQSLFDQRVQIKVNGLAPQQRVELKSKLIDDKGVVFKASAVYMTDLDGKVDLISSPSLGGTYTGVEPMGLFWSMKPETPHSKLTKREASSPLLVDIEVVNDENPAKVLAKETLERGYLSDGMRRVPLTEDRIRGVLFLPPGEGPFPAVLDLYTLGRGPSETRACLLANKGFVVLSLAFYRYQDLPKTITTFDLEYFEEAITFLRRQPQVKSHGIGIVSISKSGDLALSMASFLPGVLATVWINGCNANTLMPLHYKGQVIPPLLPRKSKLNRTESGLLYIRDVLPDPMGEGNQGTVIPIERAGGRFLLAASEDDLNWDSCFFADQAIARLKSYGKENYELVKYPKAGHFLEVPYTPLCPSSFHAAAEAVVAFGGEAKAHKEAQQDLWNRIQAFFKKHLNHQKALL